MVHHWLQMINMTTFSTLPYSSQAQSAAAELFTRIRNWKHLQTWSAGHRNTRSVFFGLQDFPEKQAHSKGEGDEGHGRKTKGNEWNFSSPSWDHVTKCLLTSACMCTEGSQFVCLCLCVRRMCRETPRQTDSWPGRQKKKKTEEQMTEVGGNCLDRLIQRVPCRTITDRVLADTCSTANTNLIKMSIMWLFSLQHVFELLRLGTGTMSPTPH